MAAFYEKTYAAMRQHIDFEKIKCVVLASPGFVKDEFLEYCLLESVRQDARDIIEHKSKFLCCHASSGYKHSLQEALSDPGVAAQLTDTKAAGEVRALAEFNTMMGEDPDRAYYGPVSPPLALSLSLTLALFSCLPVCMCVCAHTCVALSPLPLVF